MLRNNHKQTILQVIRRADRVQYLPSSHNSPENIQQIQLYHATHQEIQAIHHYCPHLQTLTLIIDHISQHLETSTVLLVSRVTSLTSLNIRVSSLSTSLPLLLTLKNLISLTLRNRNLNHSHLLQIVTELPSLSQLVLGASLFDSSWVGTLKRLQSLDSFGLYGIMELPSGVIDQICSTLQSLRSLTLFSCGTAKEEEFMCISKLTGLENLCLNYSVKDKLILSKIVESLPSLKSIRYQTIEHSPQQLKHLLHSAPSLNSLHFIKPYNAPLLLSAISEEIEGLCEFRLTYSDITCLPFMKFISHYPNLEVLDLDYSIRLGFGALKQISNLSQLRKLSIEYLRVFDSEVIYFKKLRKIEELNLKSNDITPHILSQLTKSLSKLKVIKIKPGYPITPRIRQNLQHSTAAWVKME